MRTIYVWAISLFLKNRTKIISIILYESANIVEGILFKLKSFLNNGSEEESNFKIWGSYPIQE